MKFTNTIAFRLFLLIVSVQALILGALTYTNVRIQREHLMNNVDLASRRITHVIARSMHYSMLLNRKEDIHNIINAVGGEPGIEGIRIYNKMGEVMFATSPSDIGTVVNLQAEACVSCHGSGTLTAPPPSGGQLSRLFTNANGDRILGLITPIRNEGSCANAACHAHPPEKTILGILDVKMNLAQVDRNLAQSTSQLLAISVIAVFLVSLISGGFIWMVIRRPVRKLAQGMTSVSSGDLGYRLEDRSRDELGQLARSFNKMTEDLSIARREITEWSRTLEERVREKTAELEKAHKHMVTVEKLASLGNLSATVAHELNNPLEGILTFARLLIKRIRKTSLPSRDIESLSQELQLVADEAQRCGSIVKNLLIFARQNTGQFQRVELKSILDRCEMLMKHHAQMNNVELAVNCEKELVLDCDSNQIQQAVIALMVNGIEAMTTGTGKPNGGKLVVTGEQAPGNGVRISIQDTGCGMSDEVRAHMYEPFFTTKSEGKGVGLGLAVVYGIVQSHKGSIDVHTAVGKGTTFIITLPGDFRATSDSVQARPLSKGAHHEQS
jgi:two-component system NtrC family sensor kinase